MGSIEHIHARQILDSRGNPTVEVDVRLDTGASGRAAVPSGASTGEFEATELRDGGDAWAGKGVGKAVGERQRRDRQGAHRRPGHRPGGDRRDAARARRDAEQVPARRERDPRRLAGGRARPRPPRPSCRSTSTSPSSTAPSRDEAKVLPVPMMNVINGGAHADNSVDLQEFMVVPAGAEQLLRGRCGSDRGLPRAEGDAEGARARDHGRRRGRLRPRPGVERGGARGARRRDRGGGLRARRPTPSSPSTRRPASSTASPTAPTCSSTRAAR